MIQIAPTWRVFAGGMAAGFVGVVLLAGGRASADPGFPQPPNPAPNPALAPAQVVAPPAQNLTVIPGGVNNRFAPAPAPAQVPAPVTAPMQPVVAAPAASPMPPTVAASGLAPAVAAPMPPTLTPAVTGTLRDHLQAKGVKLEAQHAQGFNALGITLPMPPRWTQVPDPNVPDAFVVIADRVGGSSVYTSNAQIVVYKLVGDFDPAEAITHGYVDSQQLLAWQTTNASLANLGAFPASVIEGTYRENDMTLNTSRRHVIATSGADKYLVSLSVTTAASQAVTDAPATDAIVNGFLVTTPGTPAQAPARVPAPTAPVQAAVPQTRPAPHAVPGQLAAPNPNPAPGPASSLPPLVTVTPVPSR